MRPVSIVIRRGGEIGYGEVAEPLRTLFRYDALAAELSRRLGLVVDVCEIDGALAVPDGLLLFDEPRLLDEVLVTSSSSDVQSRAFVLQGPRTALIPLLEASTLVGVMADARYRSWVWDRTSPLPWTVYARVDLVALNSALTVDDGGPWLESHVPIDPTGRLGVPDLLADVARAWLASQGTDGTVANGDKAGGTGR